MHSIIAYVPSAALSPLAEPRRGPGLLVQVQSPGIPPKIQRVVIIACIPSGNLEPIGWAKMEALGLLGLFSEPRFGGFGTDFCSGDTAETWKDRTELVRFALLHAVRACKGSFFLQREACEYKGSWEAWIGQDRNSRRQEAQKTAPNCYNFLLKELWNA
eukprot:1137869-Pelagomonas_calceolata.AAC.5